MSNTIDKLNLIFPEETDAYSLQAVNQNNEKISDAVEDLYARLDGKADLASGKVPMNQLPGNELLNIVYPVGTIYVGSTITNPSALLGGTWVLVYKKQKDRYISNPAAFLTHNATNVRSIDSGVALLNENSVRLRFTLTTKAAVGDTTLELVTINMTALGIAAFNVNGYVTGYSDGGNALMMVQVVGGIISSLDVIGASSIAAGQQVVFDFTQPLLWADLSDSVCDQWHWKRTA